MAVANSGKDQRPVYLVSACLLGLTTRYDGLTKPSTVCKNALQGAIWIPVCPEQLGGLPTPRTPADLVGGQGGEVLAGKARVITRSGEDVAEQFIRGARQVLKIALEQQVAGAFLKSGSPSCGAGEVLGVTAALLKSNGIPLREF
ncbi:MAG: DUF523 domain-containing protein [Thermodesulfobacteriota bacterium]